MKFDIKDVVEEVRQELEDLFRQKAFLRQYNDENIQRFKSEVANYLDKLEKECFITDAGVKRSKLPRKLKKQCKKQGVVSLDVVLSVPIIPELIVDLGEVENDSIKNDGN